MDRVEWRAGRPALAIIPLGTVGTAGTAIPTMPFLILLKQYSAYALFSRYLLSEYVLELHLIYVCIKSPRQ